MKKKEFKRFKSAVRQHYIECGPYRHIFMNYSYADILKKELRCSDSQFPVRLGVKDLAIVDGINEDFVIVS